MRPRRYKLRLFWQRVPRNEFAKTQCELDELSDEVMMSLFPYQPETGSEPLGGRRRPQSQEPAEGADAIIQEEAQTSQACACVPAIAIGGERRSSRSKDMDAARKFRVAQVFRGAGAPCVGLSFHGGGRWCVAATGDGVVRVLDGLRGVLRKEVRCAARGVGAACFGHAELCVVVADAAPGTGVRYLSLHDNRYLRAFEGHAAPVCGLAPSPASDAFFSLGEDGTCVLWDAAQRRAAVARLDVFAARRVAPAAPRARRRVRARRARLRRRRGVRRRAGRRRAGALRRAALPRGAFRDVPRRPRRAGGGRGARGGGARGAGPLGAPRVRACVEIKFRAPHAMQPKSLVDFHTGSRPTARRCWSPARRASTRCWTRSRATRSRRSPRRRLRPAASARRRRRPRSRRAAARSSPAAATASCARGTRRRRGGRARRCPRATPARGANRVLAALRRRRDRVCQHGALACRRVREIEGLADHAADAHLALLGWHLRVPNKY